MKNMNLPKRIATKICHTFFDFQVDVTFVVIYLCLDRHRSYVRP